MQSLNDSASRVAYLDHACFGPPSAATLEAVEFAVSNLRRPSAAGTSITLGLFELVEQARRRVASFLSVSPKTIALIDSTTHGLGIVASSFPWERGDNVLISDQEFLSATVIWRNLARSLGVEIRPVPSREGRVCAGDFAALADARTRAVVVSAVQEVTGYRADLDSFRNLADERKAILLVDGIQEAGALPVDLQANPVGVYVAGGHKWLRSPFGMGFLYVEPRIQQRLKPLYFGYMALQDPPGGWQDYLQSPVRTPFDRLPETTSARILETGGTPNWMGAVGLNEALSELMEMGAEEIRERIEKQTRRLREGLQELGIQVVAADPGGTFGSSDQSRHSGIVCFHLSQGLEAEKALLRELTENRVFVSLRYISGIGGIRVSPHWYNDEEDVKKLLEITTRFLIPGKHSRS